MRTFILFCLISIFLYGQNTMFIPDYSGSFNDTLVIDIKINNANNFVAFQTDIELPTQSLYIPNSAVLTERSNGHIISASLIQNNLLRVLAFSINQSPFLGDSGSVAKFKIKLKTEPGVYPILIINPIISNANSENILTSFSNGSLTIYSPKINITPSQLDFGSTPLWNSTERSVVIQNTGNLNLIVNRIYTGNKYFKIIGDTSFTISPGSNRIITIKFNSLKKGIYNTILTVESNDPASNKANVQLTAVAFAVNELHAHPSSGRSGYPIDILFSMNNMEPVVGFQFDIIIPNVISFISDSIFLTERKQDHIISANYVGANRLRVVSFSPTNKPFRDSSGYILRMKFNLNGNGGNYYYSLDNVIVSDSSAQNVVSGYYSSYINIASPDIHGNSIVDFGEVSVTDTAIYDYQIYNYGNDTLVINSLTSNNNSFWSNAVLPIVIPQGHYKNFRFYFHNNQKGSHTGRFIIRSNDSDEDPFIINLTANAFAPNYIIANSSTGFSNDTIKITISVNNYEQFVAFQFDITLPDSLEYLTNSIKLSNRKQDHIINIAKITGNVYRIISFSPTQKPFLGNSGVIVLFDALSGNLTGNLPILLSNGILSNSQSQNILKSTISGFVELFNKPSRPTLISPLNDEVVNPFNTLLQWSYDQNSTQYVVQVSTDSIFQNIIVNEENHQNNSYPLNNLSPNTKYYWRIRGKNVAGTGDWSEIWRFRTLGKPYAASLFSPPNNSINQPISNLIFKWQKAEESMKTIQSYHFQLATDSLFTLIFVDENNLSDTTITINGLSYLTDYYWRVRARNEVGWGDWSETWKLTTIIEPPTIPILASPPNNSVGLVQPVTLSWYKSNRAESYSLQVSEVPNFTTLVFSDTSLIDTSKTLPDVLSPLKQYYWRVSAKNIGGVSEYSQTWNFRTLGLPLSVELFSPPNNSINQPISNLIFKWQKAEESMKTIQSYHFQLATDSLFTLIFVDENNLSDTTITINGLSYLTDYYWRVRARNEVGWGDWSETWKLTTIIEPPTIPILASPPNNSVGLVQPVTLSWYKSNRAESYSLQVSEVPNFTTLVFSDTSLIDTSKTLPDVLSPLKQYYWRVSAKNIGGVSEYSQTWNFRTLGLPLSVELFSPPNNSINQPISNLIFKWQKAEESMKTIQSYHFQLATDSLFTLIFVDENNLSDTTITINGLSYLTDYYWRVRARNEVGWGDWSETWKLTTIIEPPTIPILASPPNNSVGLVQPVTLSWYKSNRAESYSLQVSEVPNFTTLVFSDTSLIDTSKTLPDVLSPLKQYYWRVSAKNIGGVSEYSQTWNFRTLGLPLSVELFSPPNNSINQPISNLIFKWQKAEESMKTIQSYHFQLATDSLFTLIFVDENNLSDTTITINGLSYLTDYYWRVRARNEVGWGDWSETWKLTTIIEPPTIPILASPPNNSVGLVQPVTLSWYKSNRAESYSLQVSEVPNFTTLVFSDTSLIDTSKTLPDVLSPLNQYYWRVSAKNIGGVSDTSEIWNFKTLGTPASVTLLYPENDAQNIPTTLTFFWSKAHNRESTIIYWFELATDTLGNTVILDTTLTDTSKTVTALLNDKIYYWRVNAKNEAGWGDFSEWFKFKTIRPTPSIPILIFPQNNTSGINITTTLIWGKVEYADKYHLQLSNDSSFTNIIINDSTITDTLRVVDSLQYKRMYFWRVRSINIAGISSYSNFWMFTTKIKPVNPPTSLTASVLNDGKVKLNWIDNSDNEIGFLIFRKEGDSTSSNQLICIDTVESNVISYIDSLVRDSTQYSYKLIAFNQDTISAPSNFATVFVLISLKEIQEFGMPKEYSITQNYPNPFNPSTTLRYSLPFDSYVKIELYDIAGQKITELVNGDHNAGYYELKINLSNLSSGIYLYAMNAVKKDGYLKFYQVRKMMFLK